MTQRDLKKRANSHDSPDRIHVPENEQRHALDTAPPSHRVALAHLEHAPHAAWRSLLGLHLEVEAAKRRGEHAEHEADEPSGQDVQHLWQPEDGTKEGVEPRRHLEAAAAHA